MTILNDLYNKISEATPVVQHQINGVVTVASEEERVLFLTNSAVKMLDKAWLNLRDTRNGLLKDSDWTQVSDAPVDSIVWAAYRQELRDMPVTIVDPTGDIVWPTPPSN
jgi:hypothetical protein